MYCKVKEDIINHKTGDLIAKRGHLLVLPGALIQKTSNSQDIIIKHKMFKDLNRFSSIRVNSNQVELFSEFDKYLAQ